MTRRQLGLHVPAAARPSAGVGPRRDFCGTRCVRFGGEATCRSTCQRLCHAQKASRVDLAANANSV
eukprot:10023616-Alexandrium_andersonii.AAC.1